MDAIANGRKGFGDATNRTLAFAHFNFVIGSTIACELDMQLGDGKATKKYFEALNKELGLKAR